MKCNSTKGRTTETSFRRAVESQKGIVSPVERILKDHSKGL